MGLRIDQMQLNPNAEKAAIKLQEQFPDIVFTSGRRDRAEQARAMASNVVVNRQWIGQTYVPSVARDMCQAWVHAHPEAIALADIAAGLFEVLKGFEDAELSHLSKHLSGDAFDVQPVFDSSLYIIEAIQALPNLHKFLQREGGLIRWHCQFFES